MLDEFSGKLPIKNPCDDLASNQSIGGIIVIRTYEYKGGKVVGEKCDHYFKYVFYYLASSFWNKFISERYSVGKVRSLENMSNYRSKKDILKLPL